MSDPFEYLGAGIILPFRRDGKHDFANSVGLDMVRSSAYVILSTLCSGPENEGEIRWNQHLGTQLPLMRHRNFNDETVRELAVHYGFDGLSSNDPRIILSNVNIIKKVNENKLTIKFTYTIAGESSVFLRSSSRIFSDEVTI